MTVVQHPWDPLLEIAKLQHEVHRSGNKKSGGGSADDPDPSGPGGGTNTEPSTHPYDESLDPPDNLVLTTGSFYNEIFIDASWEPSTSTNVYEYEAELTEVGFGVRQTVRTPGNAVRFSGLKPNQDYSVRVRGIATTNRSTAYLGPVTIRTGADAALPGQVQNVRMYAGVKTIQISWDDLEDRDVERGEGWYDIQLDTSITFLSPNFRFNRESGTITSFTGLEPDTTYYGRVRAIDSSGNTGPFSAVVSGTTGKAGSGDIQAEAIRADHISSDSIETRHIKADQIEGRHVKTNTLDAKSIKTSELDAAIITITASGMLRMGRATAPFNYMLQDAAGIRSYIDGNDRFSGGELNFELNINTGGAYFKGSIGSGSTIYAPFIDGGTIQGALFRTGPPPGERVEISTEHDIKFFSGDPSETFPGQIMSEGPGLGLAILPPSGLPFADRGFFHMRDTGIRLIAPLGRQTEIPRGFFDEATIDDATITESSFANSDMTSGRWLAIPLPGTDATHIWFHPASSPLIADGVIAQYDNATFLIRAARFGGTVVDKIRMESDIVEIEGKIKIMGGVPANGKVLTAVDGLGNAVWTDAGGGGGGGGGIPPESFTALGDLLMGLGPGEYAAIGTEGIEEGWLLGVDTGGGLAWFAPGAGMTGVPTYVQPTNPNMTEPGVWFQTGTSPIRVWVEDGVTPPP